MYLVIKPVWTSCKCIQDINHSLTHEQACASYLNIKACIVALGLCSHVGMQFSFHDLNSAQCSLLKNTLQHTCLPKGILRFQSNNGKMIC